MSYRRMHIETKVWDYTKSDFEFPELKETTINSKKNVGITFSGGGNRSASLTIGYLSALKHLDLIKDIRYLSCVSGGGWASIPYIYHDTSIDDKTFLGSVIDPKKMTIDDIATAPKRSFAHTISETKILDDLIMSPFAGDERFAKIMGNLYLKPYLINNRKKFFSLSKKKVKEITTREGNEELSPNDFYIANSNKPYLIAGGILARSIGPIINRYPFEMTPLYVGVPVYFPRAGSLSKFDIGGGYVEPHGFDTDSPNEEPNSKGIVTVRIRKKKHIFSLADIMATTGAALGEHLDRLRIDIGFPEFKYWCPKKPTEKAKEYDFDDGGLLDNTGIMPLLRRKVKKIIVFVNGTADLSTEKDVSTMIKALFMPIDNHYGIKNFDLNIALKESNLDGKKSYKILSSNLVQLNRSGKPAVVHNKYVTVKNKWHGIEEGDEVEIIWVHNALVQEWSDEISDSSLKAYLLEQVEKKNFPNLSTFFTNGLRIIDLELSQANLMMQHASYIVESLSQMFKNFITTP